MIEYNGNKYNSKAEVVRDLFSQGKLTLDPYSKKKVADELGMTIQTVHATLKKLMGGTSTPRKLKSLAVMTKDTTTHTRAPRESVITVIASGIKKDSDDKEITGKKIKVSWAPNPWGLPVTDPVTYVIDDNFHGDVYYYPDEVEDLFPV